MKKFKKAAFVIGVVISLNTMAQESKESYVFKDLTDIKVTSVKNQQNTGTCWSFSTTSFIEAELLRINKQEYDLSEMYFVRNAYIQKASDYVRYHGNNTFGEGGQAHDVLNQIGEFGFVPDMAYPGNSYDPGHFNHTLLDNMLKAMLDVVIKKPNKKLTPVWKKAYTAVVDTYLGEVPDKVEKDGKKLSKTEYAKSTGFEVKDYIEITSFLHHPFYEKILLEVPDNWSKDLYYNIPLDELLAVMKNSLKNGYSLVWDGDMSYKGFSHKNQLAIVTDTKPDFETIIPEIPVTPESRQAEFNNLSTTDDHLMHITGLAQDQNGTIYFKTKNSWGTDSNQFGGYLYMSESYIRLNTIAIMLHKNAIPKSIKEKLGIK